MAEIPEYKRKHAITPAAAPIGADKALGNLSDAQSNTVKAGENLITANVNKSLSSGNEKQARHQASAHKLVAGRAVADYLSNVGQQAGMERARLSGIEAAKNPGQKFLPAISQTDAEFQKSYKQEELASVGFQANRYLQKIQHEANLDPKPSAKTLEEYQKNAAKQLQIFTNQVSPENQKALERNLMGSYESGYYQIATNVENHNRKFLKTQAAVQLDQNSDEIYDNAKLGLKEGAQEKFQWAIDNINRLIDNGTIDEQEGANRRKDARRKLASGEYNRAVEEAIKDGRYDEFIKDKQENKPANMTPTEHEEIMIQTRQYASNYQSALKGQQDLIYQQTLTQIKTGELKSQPEVEQRKKEMGPHNAAALELKIVENNFKQLKKDESYNQFIQNKADANYHAENPKKEDFEENFKRLVATTEQAKGMDPGTMPLVQQIQLSQDIPRANPLLSRKVENAIAGGAPAQAIDAMLSMTNPTFTNKNTLSGVNKDAVAKALKYDAFLAAGNTAGEAYLKTQEQYANLGPKEREDLDQQFKDLTKFKGEHDISTSDNLDAEAAETLGFERGDMPAGLGLIWKASMEDNFRRSGKNGSWDQAAKMTKAEMTRVWGYSNVNGRRELMYLPPEKFVENYGLASGFIKNQLYVSFLDTEKKYKELYDNNPEQDFYYKSDIHETGTNNILEEQYTSEYGWSPSKEIKAKKIWRNGEEQDITIVIAADQRAARPEDAGLPNYFVGERIGNNIYSLRDTTNQRNPVRFHPDFNLVNKEIQKIQKNNKRAALNFLIEYEEKKNYKKTNEGRLAYLAEPEVNPYAFD